MQTDALERAWVAVQVKVNRERGVATILRQAGYEEFLPLYRPRGPHVTTPREQPLFPGYLFCRYNWRNPYRIVQAPGVIRLLGEAHAPTPIDEDEILAIRRVVESGLYSEPWRFAEPGSRVRISVGPLSGLEGTLVAVRNTWRLIVSVQLLQRAIAVEVRGTDTQVIGQAGDRLEPLNATC